MTDVGSCYDPASPKLDAVEVSCTACRGTIAYAENETTLSDVVDSPADTLSCEYSEVDDLCCVEAETGSSTAIIRATNYCPGR